MIDVQVAGADDARLGLLLERAVQATLTHFEIDEGEVSIALLGDEEMQALNRDHLGHDRPTDVISFALWEEGEPVVGDVYLGKDQAARQADDAKVHLTEEFARLAIHGSLHVLGWDHPEDAAERVDSEMYQVQESILAGLDLEDLRR